MMAFSVPVTLGSSRKMSAPTSPLVRKVIRSPNSCAAPHRLEREEVRVETPAPDHVAARGRERDHAGAREERRREQDGGTDALAELGVERIAADGTRRDQERVRTGPLCGRPRLADELEQALDIADARHVLERDGLLGEEGGADDRERGVLVAGGRYRPLEGPATFDDELGR
jgi:hypothetical protein